MSDAPKVYRSHISWDHRGATVWCHYGRLSPCGEWVEAGDTRWRRTAEWFDSEAEAKAARAGEVSAMAALLMKQAAALMEAVEVKA